LWYTTMSLEECGDFNRGSNGNVQLVGLGQFTLLLVCTPHPDTNIVLQTVELFSVIFTLLLSSFCYATPPRWCSEDRHEVFIRLVSYSSSPSCSGRFTSTRILSEHSSMRAFIYLRTKSGEPTFPHNLVLPITVLISTAEFHSLLDSIPNNITPCSALLSQRVNTAFAVVVSRSCQIVATQHHNLIPSQICSLILVRPWYKRN
jgi:hypothetical protein